MEKADMVKLAIGSIFGIAAVILSFYGDTVGVSMMAAAGIAISTIGALTIALHFYPSLFDAFEVMAILIAVIIISKIACHWYYKKIKREIGF